MNKTIKYKISSEEFATFMIDVYKGKVVWCSDQSHPVGADFKSLKNYYETRQYKCFVEEVKE